MFRLAFSEIRSIPRICGEMSIDPLWINERFRPQMSTCNLGLEPMVGLANVLIPFVTGSRSCVSQAN